MIRPLNRNVLVRPKEFKQTTDKGLILTTTTTEKPNEGIVVSKAKDCQFEIKEGDNVLYSKYAGTFAHDGNHELLILNEEDLFGVREQ